MQSRTRSFRIERVSRPERAGEAPEGEPCGGRIIGELHEIKTMIANAHRDQKQVSVEIDRSVIEDLKSELAQAAKLKKELDEIYDAINKTKREIASLHISGFDGEETARVTDELDAVVVGTEHATEKILSAAEAIDDRAGTLAAMLKRDDQGLAVDIQDKVIEIFESCNFQDLTGQRITKVVGTMRFIEDRILRMMEIWGGIESFKEIEIVEGLRRDGDAALLNGPALEGQEDVASQADIDALFA